jgi:hypothetical protein
MNRFLVPAAVAALVAGCARPDMFGLQRKQLVVVDSAPAQGAGAPTVIVRDIYHETPVVQVDTVYMEEPVPAEPVYIVQEYETYVYISEPPPPRPHNPRWSPREQEPRQSRPPRDRDELRPPSGQPVPVPPKVIVPKYPTKKTYAPGTDDLQKSPDRPTPPDQLVPPKRQAPAQGGSAPAAPVQHESPKQVPTPPTDKSAGLGSGA